MLSHRLSPSPVLWTADGPRRQAAAVADPRRDAAHIPATAVGCCSRGQSTRALGVAGGDLGSAPVLGDYCAGACDSAGGDQGGRQHGSAMGR